MRNGVDHGSLVDVGLKPDLRIAPHVGRPCRSEAEAMPADSVSIARAVKYADPFAGIARRIRRDSDPKRTRRAGQNRPTLTVWPIAARKRATHVGRPYRSEAKVMPADSVSIAHDVNHPDAVAGIARRIRRDSDPKRTRRAGQGRPTLTVWPIAARKRTAPVGWPYRSEAEVMPADGVSIPNDAKHADAVHTTGNHP